VRPTRIAACATVVIVAAVSGTAVAASPKTLHYSFQKTAVPAKGKSCTNNRVQAINDKGWYGGTYYCDGPSRGFIAKAGRKKLVADFRAPGGKKTDTQVVTLANNGDAAVITYQHYKAPYAAYIRSRAGRFTKVRDPKAGSAGTRINGVNSKGVAVGSYLLGGPKSNYQAYVDDKGTYTDVTPIGTGVVSSYLASINDKGELVGGWADQQGAEHGFVVKNGKMTDLKVPGAGSAQGDGVFVSSVASNGDIAGVVAGKGKVRGFIVRGGKVALLKTPKFAKAGFELEAINRHDAVGGDYFGSDHLVHGYVARLK
jgi:probable HAF family extracellular repeat protein